MAECIFCKIVSGKSPSQKIYETKKTLAFAPLKEHIIARGHMLVIPKKHYADIYEIPESELNAVMNSVKIISQKLKEKYRSEGINILHASGKVAQQSCFHFHIHLIPRYKNDGIDTWPNTNYKEDNFLKTYEEMSKILQLDK